MEAGWHFRCPECGFGNDEHGRLATDFEWSCEICLDELGLTIRLDRWFIADALPSRETEPALD